MLQNFCHYRVNVLLHGGVGVVEGVASAVGVATTPATNVGTSTPNSLNCPLTCNQPFTSSIRTLALRILYADYIVVQKNLVPCNVPGTAQMLVR